MKYTLKRINESPEVTLGEIRDPKGEIICVTCEDPWKNNKPRESCIPKGTYEVVRHGWAADTQVKFKRVWQLLNVPGRSAILMHAGNLPENTLGCILCGTAFGMIGNEQGIVGSRAAIDKLRQILPERFTLTIE